MLTSAQIQDDGRLLKAVAAAGHAVDVDDILTKWSPAAIYDAHGRVSHLVVQAKNAAFELALDNGHLRIALGIAEHRPAISGPPLLKLFYKAQAQDNQPVVRRLLSMDAAGGPNPGLFCEILARPPVSSPCPLAL